MLWAALALGAQAQADEGAPLDLTPGRTSARVEASEPRGSEQRADAGRALVMPFEREVGDRWGIVIERTVRRFDGRVGRERREMIATIRAPRGTGWLVALQYTSVRMGDRSIELGGAEAATRAYRDRLGGGLLLLAVDGRGTATRVLNHKAVREALERHAHAQGRETIASAALTALLADWNTVYAACGVELDPGEIHRRKIAVDVVGGEPLEGAQARRLVRETTGRRTLVFTSHARFGGDADASDADASDAGASSNVAFQTQAPTRVDQSTWRIEDKERIRFDEVTRRIEGKHMRTIRDGHRQASILVKFHETPAPDA